MRLVEPRKPSFDRIFPVEILGMIFLAGSKSEHGNDFLINISSISRYWRGAALSTPALWWNVVVVLTSVEGSERYIDRARAWLARSGSTPIRVWARCHGSRELENGKLEDEVYAVLDLVIQHLFHCRALVLDHRGNPYARHCVLRNLGAIVKSIGSAPILRDLCLFGSGLPDNDGLSYGTLPLLSVHPERLPSLQRLRLRDEPSTQFPSVTNLTALQYRRDSTYDLENGTPIGQIRLSVQDVLNLISNSPEIEYLDISDIAAGPRNSDREKVVVLPKLRWLDVSFRSTTAMLQLIRRISLPVIEHLSLDVHHEDEEEEIQDGERSNQPQFRDEVFPFLRDLRLSLISSHVITSILRRAPDLRSCWLDNVYDSVNASTSTCYIIDFLITPSAAGDLKSITLPCPKIKSFCFTESDSLTVRQILRLADAYVPASKARRVCTSSYEDTDGLLDFICASSTKLTASGNELSFLRRRVRWVDLAADKWPDLDADPFDFTRIPFHDD